MKSSDGSLLDEVSTSFDLLAPVVKRHVLHAGWMTLRPIQERAIHAILGLDADVAIIAPTAGGKTEAAILPLVSQLVEAEPSGTIDVLYIAPLKALINDVVLRMESLCEAAGVWITGWHGDVSTHKKEKLRRKPGGIVVITPESIEATFMRGPREQVRSMFSGLRAVVIDEVHSFIGTERGRQLQSLLHRIDVVAKRRHIRRIALSATVADSALLAQYLNEDHPGEVLVLDEDAAVGGGIDVQVRGFGSQATAVDVESSIASAICAFADSNNTLIFANRRAEVESYTQLARKIAAREQRHIHFIPHHGSLSSAQRKAAEDAMKDGTQPTTIIATSTLELGIDVGDVSAVGQIGAPPSVASLRQRVGRSGRRGSRPKLEIWLSESQVGVNTPPHLQIRADVVQTIAMLNLMSVGWYEPPLVGAPHVSTLIQQIVSSVVERSGAQERLLWHLLCEKGPFRVVSEEAFNALIAKLLEKDVLERVPGGQLLVGSVGEKLMGRPDFFAAFTVSDEYRVVTTGETIGSMPVSPTTEVGDRFVLGGRLWQIALVDHRRKTIEVERADAADLPRFNGAGVDIHDRVRFEMRRIYRETSVAEFLDVTAAELLAEGRANYRRLGLLTKDLVAVGADATVWFPWVGDRALYTLIALMKSAVRVHRTGVALTFPEAGLTDVIAAASGALRGGQTPETLAAGMKLAPVEKHDRFANDELLRDELATRRLNLESAVAALERLVVQVTQ